MLCRGTMRGQLMGESPPTDPHLDTQLSELQIDNAPLVVCDIDEVVLHFIKPFRIFLQKNGYILHSNDYSLKNNIKEEASHRPANAEVTRSMVTDFFQAEIDRQPIVEGARETLDRLSRHAQVIFLTNIPHDLGHRRREALEDHGLPHPLITHSGPKGPTVARLADRTSAEIFFLDDSPPNLLSVSTAAHNVHLIQFVADDIFFQLAPELSGIHLKTRDWEEVGAYIGRHVSPSDR